MLRGIWFALKVGLLVIISVWLIEQPGVISLSWQDYNISVDTGVAALAVFFFILGILLLYRIVLNIAALPRRFYDYRQRKRENKGYKALTLGLTAVAAGDAKLAHYQSVRANKFIPHKEKLATLLEGQAAYLKGDDEAARQSFRKLLDNKDTAFLGLRGLLTAALDRNDFEEAESLVQRALKLYPRQPWILRMAYDLEIRRQNWDKAYDLAYKSEKYEALPPEQARRDRVALLLKQAEDAASNDVDESGKAFKKIKKAYKMDNEFIPAATRLSRAYLNKGKHRKARKIIEKAWQAEPHPDLLPLWKKAAPKKYKENGAKELAWIEKLVALNPDHHLSQLAAAEEAIHQHLWGQAEQYLKMAESLSPDARLYRLWAHMEEIQGHTEEANRLLERAQDAAPEKVWTCIATGQVYDDWAPIARPHGSFNTIIWGYPHLSHPDTLVSDRHNLLITSPQR